MIFVSGQKTAHSAELHRGGMLHQFIEYRLTHRPQGTISVPCGGIFDGSQGDIDKPKDSL
jgi:hypothetical protein